MYYNKKYNNLYKYLFMCTKIFPASIKLYDIIKEHRSTYISKRRNDHGILRTHP